MKKSELRQMIKEELETLSEGMYKVWDTKKLSQMLTQEATYIANTIAKKKTPNYSNISEMVKELKKRK